MTTVLKFSELNLDDQERAIHKAKSSILNSLAQGLSFPELERQEKKINKAIEQAEKLETPWFTVDYLLEALENSKDFKDLTIKIANDRLYTKSNLEIIKL